MAKFGWTTDEQKAEQAREQAREQVEAEAKRRILDPDVLMALFAPEDEAEEADARAYLQDLRSTRAEARTAADPKAVSMPPDLQARRDARDRAGRG